MEFWCARNNRFEDFGKGITPLALVPCTGPGCEEWEEGPARYCIQLVRYDKGMML
jgi:hypothetical protein